MSITLLKTDITLLPTDAIVNAANDGLWGGHGVCGAIFNAAGYEEMTGACRKYGHCDTGKAVITPGFRLPAKHVIHAVGPIWQGGRNGEPEQLYSAYKSSLQVAKENGLHSIAFPLISAGIYGYPLEGAWRRALEACRDFLGENQEYELAITFAILDQSILEVGQRILKEVIPE